MDHQVPNRPAPPGNRKSASIHAGPFAKADLTRDKIRSGKLDLFLPENRRPERSNLNVGTEDRKEVTQGSAVLVRFVPQ